MPTAQEQHGFLFEFVGIDLVALGQAVIGRHSGHKGLVIKRGNSQVGVGEGLGQNGGVNLAQAQLVEQLDGEVFLQHERHLRRAVDHLAYQAGQQIRANGVDDAQAQRPCQRVFAALGNFFDGSRLLQHDLRLAHDFFAQGRDGHFAGIALKEFELQLFFEFFNGHAECGLRDEARLSSAAKVFFARHGNDVFEFGQGHGAGSV